MTNAREPGTAPVADWKRGTAVFDRGSQMVGVVHEQHGTKLILTRPSGLRWHTRTVAVRAANDRELIQLRALVRHNRNVRAPAAIRGER
ncbi:hypothetical protein [Streptomyces sp. TLI_146]|uniref:hypothetical protein n=1 Tax=Streptomyces sp. TLI_146 TaxID=1938858 RepID=UPI000CCA4EE5|nr:hypothetical protein [Streptomyces sp. TLI_146]PKV88874.1 hypothetical protein BX283_6501 [Streptomyces sp. TLI_146]